MIFNRDISWLSFNKRVLQEATIPDVPLVERFKFLAIFSSNLDEFFRVRFPAVTALSALGSKFRKRTIPPTNKYLARQVKRIVNDQLNCFGNILTGQLLPALKDTGTVLYYNETLLPEHERDIQQIFLTRVMTFLHPLAIDKNFITNFFPANDQPYFFVTIREEKTDIIKHVVVNIPTENLPRFFTLPPVNGLNYIIFMDDIIRVNMQVLFPGYTVSAVSTFKISRDAELVFEEVIAKDILKEIEKKIEKRKAGKPCRLLIEKEMPLSVRLFLKSLFKIKDDEVFEGGSYHNLKDLMSLPVKDKELHYDDWPALPALPLKGNSDLFSLLQSGDRLLHFPYHSFDPMLYFFNYAAIDPEVVSIQVALYRVASESFIANALINAAKNGKKVTVFMELKARFDEANNIKWSKKMKEAGVIIINNIHNIKVHSKIALVMKEKTGYAIIGTGNFNEKTAKLYADHALMTSDNEIIADLKKLFQGLQGNDYRTALKALQPQKLLIAQVNMVSVFEDLIKEQIREAKAGRPALIRMKMNNLEDPGIIQLLYKASRAGVVIRLLIRGICCIMPGKKKHSENIITKRIVGRYLEHSRIFIFGEGPASKTFIGSADMMTRNLHYRIEVAVPICDTALAANLATYFEIQWQDESRSHLENKEAALVTDNSKTGSQYEIYSYLKENIA